MDFLYKFQFFLLVLTPLWVSPVFSNSSIFHNPICTKEENKCHCSDTIVHDEDSCDIRLCGADRMCRQYHQIEKYIEEHRRNGTFEIRNVTGAYDINDSMVQYVPGNFRHVDGRLCENRQSRPNYANESSFSPWRFIINHDANRYPMDILETQCICTLCLNSDRTATQNHYQSHPFMVTRYFHLEGHGNKTFHADFSYGCFCEYINDLVGTRVEN